MQSRRKFIAQTSGAVLGTLLVTPSLEGKFLSLKKLPVYGLQLYTLFPKFEEDVTGNLKKISDIGYVEIESSYSLKAGFYGMKPMEFAQQVKDAGMNWRAHHVIGAPFRMPAGAKPPVGADGKPIIFPPMKNLRDNYQELVDLAAEGGVQYLVCANIPISTAAEIKEGVEIFNKTSLACKKAGLSFAYHNHATEFDIIEGIQPFDYILSNTDKNLVKMELDLGWASKAGQDPVELFKKHPGRFPLWHVKDFSADFKTITEVGAGSIDFKRIFEHAKISGMKFFFLEQDGAPDPYVNISNGLKNMKKILE
jgi:sugar phosphate isomerase/epimerase